MRECRGRRMRWSGRPTARSSSAPRLRAGDAWLAPRHEEEIADLVACALDRLELRRLHELVLGRRAFDALADAAEQLGARQDALVRIQLVEERASEHRVAAAAFVEHRLIAAR